MRAPNRTTIRASQQRPLPIDALLDAFLHTPPHALFNALANPRLRPAAHAFFQGHFQILQRPLHRRRRLPLSRCRKRRHSAHRQSAQARFNAACLGALNHSVSRFASCARSAAERLCSNSAAACARCPESSATTCRFKHHVALRWLEQRRRSTATRRCAAPPAAACPPRPRRRAADPPPRRGRRRGAAGSLRSRFAAHIEQSDRRSARQCLANGAACFGSRASCKNEWSCVMACIMVWWIRSTRPPIASAFAPLALTLLWELAWVSIKSSTGPQVCEEHLANKPNGHFMESARAALLPGWLPRTIRWAGAKTARTVRGRSDTAVRR